MNENYVTVYKTTDNIKCNQQYNDVLSGIEY